jgi:hypothetical protein
MEFQFVQQFRHRKIIRRERGNFSPRVFMARISLDGDFFRIHFETTDGHGLTRMGKTQRRGERKKVAEVFYPLV